MKRWIRCVPGFVLLVVFSIFCAQTVMAAETGTTTDPSQEEMIKPEPEIDIIKEPESVYYRVVVDDMIEGAQVECPDQAAAGETVPVLVRADGDYSIRRVVANYYDASFEGHQIEMDPLMEDEDGVHYEFSMPDADVAIFVMTEVMHNVTVLKSDGGTVTASHDRAGLNDSVALTAEPEEGYRFASWEVHEESGSQIGVGSDDTFLMGSEAVTVRAIFEKLKGDYSITLTQSGEGTIVSSGERANAGETVTVTPSAQSGYRLERITVTANTPGADVVLEDTEEKESYSFTMPEGDVTVHVQFDNEIAEGSRVIPKQEKVLQPITVIKLFGVSHNIANGKKIQLTKAISPGNATNIKLKWTSSNPKVATVNQNGLVVVRPKTGGKSVVITAAATDGSGKKATWIIKSMKGVVKKIKLSGKKKVKAGKALKLKAKVKATKGANKKLKWTSNNTKWATVNGSGKVKTLKAGKGKKVKITAQATDGSAKKKTVTIKIK